jgi:hypothetical protein
LRLTISKLRPIKALDHGSDFVMPVAHDALDITIAIVASIVAVSLFFPVYLLVVLAKTVVRRAKASATT